jgi:hypothetical protein
VIAAIIPLIPADYRALLHFRRHRSSIVPRDQAHDRSDHLLFRVVVDPETVLNVGQLGEEIRWVVTWMQLHLHDSFRELQLAHCVMGTKLLEQSLDDEMDFAIGPSCCHSFGYKPGSLLLKGQSKAVHRIVVPLASALCVSVTLASSSSLRGKSALGGMAGYLLHDRVYLFPCVHRMNIFDAPLSSHAVQHGFQSMKKGSVSSP